MRRYLLAFSLMSSLWGISRADSFDDLKKRLHDAGCIKTSFVATTSSELFNSVDTVKGKAQLAADGRYFIQLGDEEFLLDSISFYSYSKENDQVVIRRREESAGASEALILRELDVSYRTAVIVPLAHYRLTRKDSVDVTLPDSMDVRLTKGGKRLSSVSYRNENGDLITVTFDNIETAAKCDSAAFIPAFPPSAERVKL